MRSRGQWANSSPRIQNFFIFRPNITGRAYSGPSGLRSSLLPRQIPGCAYSFAMYGNVKSKSYMLADFLPCDAVRCTVLVIVILSVRLSVCHTRALCPHGSTYDHDFFTIW